MGDAPLRVDTPVSPLPPAMARGCRGARLASELPQGQGSCVGIQGCSIEPHRGQRGHWGDSPEELGPPPPLSIPS